MDTSVNWRPERIRDSLRIGCTDTVFLWVSPSCRSPSLAVRTWRNRRRHVPEDTGKCGNISGGCPLAHALRPDKSFPRQTTHSCLGRESLQIERTGLLAVDC